GLISYIVYQYYQCHVTQPLLLEELHEFGIDISSGQINRIVVEGYDDFHTEKDDILSTGLEISPYIHVDDTGARHKGKNGVCTHIGNELFAWFKSTESKSRINFLDLLRGGHRDYHVSEEGLDYMEEQKLPKAQLQILKEDDVKAFSDQGQWESHLQRLGIVQARHIQIATEGALLGSVLEHGFNRDMVILSDDAGQFNIHLHALCWIHAERTIRKIVPFTEKQRAALESCREKIWDLYADLKLYKENPTYPKKMELENRFDEIFQEETCFMTLNRALKRLYSNKTELLLVLDRPEIPLHNNLSETDIREYVKRRKVSGSTRSDPGRECRDTFTSLKKTCRKLEISFWDYLNDRIGKLNTIPQLELLMRQSAPASTF
ncbi:MAG: transposase, partial [Candidatus Brocadiaceae bacterium]|nr:transposase [Candidatus Brocadiaceae bacterium]